MSKDREASVEDAGRGEGRRGRKMGRPNGGRMDSPTTSWHSSELREGTDAIPPPLP